MLQKKGKYLYFAYDIYAGLDDQITILELMMTAALSLQRILIVKDTETASQHRTSKKYIPFDWARYVDLAQTKIAEIMSDGSVKEIKSTFLWLHEKDFNFKEYASEQIHYIDGDQLYDSENEHYSVLYVSKIQIARTKKNRETLKAQGITISWHYNLIYKAAYHVSLSPSSRVDELSDAVLHQFGTDRQSSDYMQTTLNSKTRLKKHDFRFNYYICMHIRAKDRALIDEHHYHAMQKKQIKSIVKTVSNMHCNIPIYIMSDIRAGYFDFLRPEYQIYTYRDFPVLKELFDSKEKPVDHNLLYAVEKNIMKYALVKIFPPGRNRLRLDTDASYEIPPHISQSFDASAKKRMMKYQAISYMNVLDRIIIKLKNKFRG